MRSLDTTEIDNILNDFVAQFDEELECFSGTDFGYYYESSRIEYPFVMSERGDRLFMEFAKSIGLKVDIDCFMLSLLHEVFHHLTFDDLSDSELLYSQDVKDELGDSDEDYNTYFNLPDERVATEFAIEWANESEEYINEFFQEKLMPALKRFYEKNEIDYTV